MEEMNAMACEDKIDHLACKPKRPLMHITNIHKEPGHVTKWDANARLQKSDPEWYGPYLQEGEKYHTPRTKENTGKNKGNRRNNFGKPTKTYVKPRRTKET